MHNLTLSITQLNNYIKKIFDSEEILLGVSVYGEITNFKISNNIAYFDIKEEGAQLSCVKFATYFPFAKNGDKVLVTGRLNYHVKLGRLSFVASKVEPYGMGELYKKYLELKARLESEGLFDQSKKQPIPKYANKIGVVTSETGAVIRDIYHVTRNKNPYTNILVYPSKVQGEGAEKEIVDGIEYFNKEKNVDVIIVARGGGSFEDLSPFNTEIVARAAFESQLPVISAIGHETDFSILDFAADLRAPTPSVAAEEAVFDYYQELEYLDSIKCSLKNNLNRFLSDHKNRIVNQTQMILKTIDSKLDLSYKDYEQINESVQKQMQIFLDKKRADLNILITKIEKSNPLAILQSGYAKVISGNKTALAKNVKPGDTLETYLSDGVVFSRVERVKENK